LKKYTTTRIATPTKTRKTKPLGALGTDAAVVRVCVVSAFLTLKITLERPTVGGCMWNFRPQWQMTLKPFELLGLTHLNALG
jgi:hypothetical protein